LEYLCHQNEQQIDLLMKQIKNQHEQIKVLKEDNKNLKSKLKKNTEDTLQIKLENKQVWDAIHKLNKMVIGRGTILDTLSGDDMNNGSNNLEYYHPKGYELYHPKELIHKKIHKASISLIHSKEIKPQIIERRYHSKIRNDNGYWTCCNGDGESEGCSIEETTIMIYPCCGKRENSDGCMKGYKCCGGNVNSIGCKDISYYPCCNKKKKHKNGLNGCHKRYICCKQPFSQKSKGCKLNVQ